MTKQPVKKPDRKELRYFSITIAIVFWAIGGLVLWRQGKGAFIYFIFGSAILLAGMLWPRSLVLFYKAWMALSLALGFIMSHVILALVFYVVLTPIGLFRRIFVKDPLNLRFDPKAGSYWIKKEKSDRGGEDYERMF